MPSHTPIAILYFNSSGENIENNWDTGLDRRRFWFRPFVPQFHSGAKSCASLTPSGGLLPLPRSGEQWALCSIKVKQQRNESTHN